MIFYFSAQEIPGYFSKFLFRNCFSTTSVPQNYRRFRKRLNNIQIDNILMREHITNVTWRDVGRKIAEHGVLQSELYFFIQIDPHGCDNCKQDVK